ncbi:MAG: caspase family protein [Pyrinomonadaceae bacterium]
MNILFRLTALTFTILISVLGTSVVAQFRTPNRDRGLGVNKTPPPALQRVALVIGNSAYASAPLKNPVNDARDIAQALRELGFEVIYRENVNQNDMKRAIRMFGERTKTGGTRLFYYAGHGVQAKGENYLIPIGADFNNEQEVEYETVNLGLVLAQMEEVKNSINIVVLDACRNNPFVKSTRSASRGLASVDAPTGTLIAYATAPGSVASDGTANNGIYTQELLRYMRMPGVSVEEIFKRIRISVRDKTQGKQTPWESSSLTGDFFFMGGKDAPPVKEEVSRLSIDSAAIELSFWDSIKLSNEPDDFKEYLQRFPNGTFSALAKRKLSSLQRPTASDSEVGQESVSALMTKKSNSFTFTIRKCGASGTTAFCEVLITNNGTREREIEFGFRMRFLDEQGNQAEFLWEQSGIANGTSGGIFVPEIPVTAIIYMSNVGDQARKMSLLAFEFIERGVGGFTVEYRNVSLDRNASMKSAPRTVPTHRRP